MKALILKRYGGANHIAFAVIPRPALKPDEMLVQVHAAHENRERTLRYVPAENFSRIATG
jgi:NADPH:quinone reductase-like Zn-dependent oxidoreductase